MKTPNSLEEQLRSWTPRRPSPEIEQTLFGTGNPAPRLAPRRRAAAWHWQPVLGAVTVSCLLVTVTLLNLERWADGRPAAFAGGWISASNRSELASLDAVNTPHNVWSAPILGWTSNREVESSLRPLYLLNTNHSLR